VTGHRRGLPVGGRDRKQSSEPWCPASTTCQPLGRAARRTGGLHSASGEPDCTWADIAKIQLTFVWRRSHFEEGVGRILADIDYWRDAPLWDPESVIRRRPAGSRPYLHKGWPPRWTTQAGSLSAAGSDGDGTPGSAPDRARRKLSCHSTFDIVHPGRASLLYAKASTSIASLTADAHIVKANFRHQPQELRAFNLAALGWWTSLLSTASNPIRILPDQADCFAKGCDTRAADCIHARSRKKTAVEGYGARSSSRPVISLFILKYYRDRASGDCNRETDGAARSREFEL
jgi:hypothetical protein